MSLRHFDSLGQTAGAPGRTLKLVRGGTHRARTFEQTLHQVLRVAPVMGITRVANVTGLDVIGIPVVMICRPNSRSVAVSQGKGLQLAGARASGLMEACELYHAETITLPLRLATYEELRYRFNVVDVDELPRGSRSIFHPHLRLPWCTAQDLSSGESVLVPYEMVHTNYTIPLPDGHGCFPATSNGLASGNIAIEAISHGVCEVIERDATTLWKLRSQDELDSRRIDLASIDDPDCQETLAKLSRAGLLVSIWDITTDIHVATFACVIIPHNGGALWHSAVDTGCGCHPAREVALLRALTEAAQSRLTTIAGVRDDFREEAYEQLLDTAFMEGIRRRIIGSGFPRGFRDVSTFNGETLEEDVEWELEQINKAGIRRVLVVDLTKPEFGIPVVRVIIPGLEPILESGYSPGPRAEAVLAGKR